eukprot:scaffold46252_cov92-Phaeocystis_antarctica.AAC.2
MAQKAQQNERTEERLRDLPMLQGGGGRAAHAGARGQAAGGVRREAAREARGAQRRAAGGRGGAPAQATSPYTALHPLHPLIPPRTPLHTLAHPHTHTPSRTPHAPLTHPSRTPRAPLTRQVLKLSGGRWEAERAQLLHRITQLEAQLDLAYLLWRQLYLPPTTQVEQLDVVRLARDELHAVRYP